MSEKAIFVTKTVTQVSTTDLEGVGTLRWAGNKCYRWVKNADDAAFIAGQAVFHKAGDAANFYSNAYEALTAQLMFLAGVCVSAIAVSGYGWIQCLGHNATVAVKNASGTTYAIGDYLIGANGQTGFTVDAATQALYKKNVQLLEAVATVTTTLIAYANKACIINALD